MHDRRIDGQVFTFGNASSLYMNAMTWWDHETESIWSQPIGRALNGELRGVELFLLPARLTTWGEWQRAYPESLVMITDMPLLQIAALRDRFRPDFVIGVVLDGQARAYPYAVVAEQRIIDDRLGSHPITIWATDSGGQAFSRSLEGLVLTFSARQNEIFDDQTGSRLDATRGLALEGTLAGHALRQLPTLSAYDWAWRDFYPDAEIYRLP